MKKLFVDDEPDTVESFSGVMLDRFDYQKILFVDDVPNILDGFRRVMSNFGFDVHTALGPEEGLKALQGPETFAVVLADFKMPGMDGITFLCRVREIAPDTVRMMLTGYPDVEVAMGAVNEGQVFRFLTKPVRPDVMAKSLHAALEQYHLVMTQEKVKRQAALINALIDSVPDIIFFKDLNGVYLGCNTQFAEFIGQTNKTIVGKTDYELFDKETADSFRYNDNLMHELGKPRHNEEWITYPDGRKRLVNTLKAPYWGSDRELLGVLGISRDITEIRHLEQVKEDVERIFRHDLKSPLTGIINILKIVEGDNLFEDQMKMLKLVEQSGRKMLNLINSSLEIYKIENGIYQSKATLCDPVKIVTENADMLAMSLRIIRDLIQIQVRTDVHESVHEGGLSILTDNLLLDIVAMNLMKNALEASDPDMPVIVDMSVEQDDLVLTISNSRPVPAEVRERFFEKYASAGKKGGTGLGTYSAFIMTRAMGGTIDMETSDETGTKVTVRIPVSPRNVSLIHSQ